MFFRETNRALYVQIYTYKTVKFTIRFVLRYPKSSNLNTYFEYKSNFKHKKQCVFRFVGTNTGNFWCSIISKTYYRRNVHFVSHILNNWFLSVWKSARHTYVISSYRKVFRSFSIIDNITRGDSWLNSILQSNYFYSAVISLTKRVCETFQKFFFFYPSGRK